MAAAVNTVARPATVTGCVMGNKKVRYRDITSDTGDYGTGGFTLTAGQLVSGMHHIDMVTVGSLATQGTAGASACGVGVTYSADGTSVTFQLYEAAASGAPFLEKNAEAMVANFTFRVKVEGW